MVDELRSGADDAGVQRDWKDMVVTLREFDRKEWISRFGEALEDVAANARPQVAFRMDGPMKVGLYRREQHRRYREMAALARTDPFAAKLFDESHLWIDTLPQGIQDLLLEHPLLERAWSGGRREGFHIVEVFGHGHADVKSLITDLAKLSVKAGGRYAATLLHRFIVAGEDVRLHANEIIVLHGLKLDEPITLGRGTCLASYDSVRRCFGLPEDPEPWLRPRDEGLDRHPGRLARASTRSVLVRQFNWGPAIAPCNCPTNKDSNVNLRYWFPEDHRVDSITGFFEEREALVQLLSIALRSKLVSHTAFTALPSWMKQLDPNLRTMSPGGDIGVFDVWPEDRTPSMQDINDYKEAAQGWLSSYAGKRVHNMEVAVRRTVASFGIAGGRFGFEDRIIDAAIALEAMYGSFGSGEITHKISLRAAWMLGKSAAERRRIFRDMRSLYRVRSQVVHGRSTTDEQKREQELVRALSVGRELARSTLFALLSRSPVKDENEWYNLVLEGPRSGSKAERHSLRT